MKAYFLLLIYYLVLFVLLGMNVLLMRHVRQHFYIGKTIRLVTFTYLLFWLAILILTHFYVFFQNWQQIISLNDFIS